LHNSRNGIYHPAFDLDWEGGGKGGFAGGLLFNCIRASPSKQEKKGRKGKKERKDRAIYEVASRA
jgi:hypothetical protein